MLNKLTLALTMCPDDGSIYLIEKLSDVSGFFMVNKHLLYMVLNIEGAHHQSLSTELLRLNTNIDIAAIGNNQQFPTGKYNVLEILPFDGKYENEYLSSFVNMCVAHTEYMNATEFVKYFYSLVNLFQYPKEQKFANLIGLFGELTFLKYVVEKTEYDFSDKWHNSGSTDKYDISLSNCNFEIKSTISSEELITVKHTQIFNSDHNFLVSVLLEDDNSGTSLNQLIKSMQDNSAKYKSFNFALNVEKERRRISPVDAETKKFSLKHISIYDAKLINPFQIIPNNVSELTYRLDLAEKDPVSIMDLKKEFESE